MAREARIFAGRLDSDSLEAMSRAADMVCVFEERS
jgi:hypothetical protein